MNKKIIAIVAASVLSIGTLHAGNKDRSGQAAASELLVNPWAGTCGLFGMNGASVSGIEAMKLNIAGLAKTNGMELGIAHTNYLMNTGVRILNAGYASSFRGKSKIGINLMSVDYGSIPVTTVGVPQGAGNTFKPSFFNIGLGYAYSFAKNIDAGINLTFVNEGVTNAKASAVGLDAGIMYTTGFRDELHFGVTLRNVGSNIRFAGDGLSYSSTSIDDQDKYQTVNIRSEKFQLPTQLGISTAYDIYLGTKVAADVDSTYYSDSDTDGSKLAAINAMRAKGRTKLTLNGSFISNAFINDYLGLGAELNIRERFFVRAGYRYEAGITNVEKTVTLFNGIAAGAGASFNLSKENNRRAQIDYGFKPSRLGAVHAVTVRIFY